MLGPGVRVLIIGGTRYLGRTLCERALMAGAEVTLLNRGRTPDAWLAEGGYTVRRVLGDRRDPQALAQAFDRDYDAVFDMIAYHPEDVAPLLAPPHAPRIAHLLVCSTTSVYAPALYVPIDEEHPRGPHPGWGDYNRGKNGVEDLLAGGTSGVRATVLRPQWVFGPHDHQHLAEFYLARVASGRPVWLWHPGLAQLNWTYAPDLAAAFCALAGEAIAVGRAYNVCCEETLTTLEFIALCGETLGGRPDVRFYDPAALPGELRGVRLGSVRPQPLACTCRRLRGDAAWSPTPMRRALAETAAWLAGHGALEDVRPTPAEEWLAAGS